jgi:rhomboid protease GluP
MTLEVVQEPATPIAEPPIDPEVERAIAYQQELHARTPAGTYGLIAVCVTLFGLQSLWGGFEGDGSVLYAMGSSFGPAVKGGELYRLLSAAFLHFGPVHLLMNMAALLSFGPLLERHLGTARYLVLYALCAAGGSVLSVLVHGNVNSAGASGAVWGLMGGALALGLFPRGLMPRVLAQQLYKGLLPPLVMNGIYSVQGGIDFAAHLGGGVFGFALVALGLATLGLQRPFADPMTHGRPWLDRTFQALALLGTLLVFSCSTIAITRGKPWFVKTPPPMVAGKLEGTSLTVNVPSEMSRPLVTADARSGDQTFVFGDLEKGTSQLTLRVYRASPYDQLLLPVDMQKKLLEALPGAGAGLTLSTAKHTAMIAGHSVAAEEMTGPDAYRVREWALSVGDALVVASLHQIAPSPAWLAAGEQMIASLQSSAPSELQWARAQAGDAPFSLELPTVLDPQTGDSNGTDRHPGAQFGAPAVVGASVFVDDLSGELSDRALSAAWLEILAEKDRRSISGLPVVGTPEVITLGARQALHKVGASPDGKQRAHRYLLLLDRHVLQVEFYDEHPTDALEPFHQRIIASLRPETEPMGGIVGGVVHSK